MASVIPKQTLRHIFIVFIHSLVHPTFIIHQVLYAVRVIEKGDKTSPLSVWSLCPSVENTYWYEKWVAKQMVEGLGVWNSGKAALKRKGHPLASSFLCSGPGKTEWWLGQDGCRGDGVTLIDLKNT